MQDLLAGRLPFEWVTARMLSDDPAKGLGGAPDAAMVWPRLRDRLRDATGTLRLVSPYFVPGAVGVEALATLARRGVRIAILTNSLEATDVAVVHSGYAKRRRALLAAGIALFELKRASPRPSGKRGGPTVAARSGSSASILHAKTFAVDCAQVFIGSFNFDPRSARLNTEMGFLIDSPTLASALTRRFAEEIPRRAYQVRWSEGRDLQWVERRNDGEVVYSREPGAGVGRRSAIRLLSMLPIEWLL